MQIRAIHQDDMPNDARKVKGQKRYVIHFTPIGPHRWSVFDRKHWTYVDGGHTRWYASHIARTCNDGVRREF